MTYPGGLWTIARDSVEVVSVVVGPSSRHSTQGRYARPENASKEQRICRQGNLDPQ